MKLGWSWIKGWISDRTRVLI